MIERKPIMPERLRRIGDGSFGFIPHRFLRDGFLSSLTTDELALYLILVLAADRKSISFYAYDRICSVLELTLERYINARNALIDKNLIAFDGTRFQVLSLPEQPVRSPSKPLLTHEEREEHDPATARQLILDSLGSEDTDQYLAPRPAPPTPSLIAPKKNKKTKYIQEEQPTRISNQRVGDFCRAKVGYFSLASRTLDADRSETESFQQFCPPVGGP